MAWYQCGDLQLCLHLTSVTYTSLLKNSRLYAMLASWLISGYLLLCVTYCPTVTCKALADEMQIDIIIYQVVQHLCSWLCFLSDYMFSLQLSKANALLPFFSIRKATDNFNPTISHQTKLFLHFCHPL